MRWLKQTTSIVIAASIIGLSAQAVTFAEEVGGLPNKEVQCLAKNIYFEAKNQGTGGWLAVAFVTLNRVKDTRYPNTICEVVYQGPSKPSWQDPKKQIPSAQESFEEFETVHLSLSEDKKSGFITLSIKHQSPFVAKQWVELIVNEINAFYRQKDKLESEKAVSYLNQQISMTGLSEIKQVLAQLLQEETKKLTLIEANQFYVFDYIDPPAVMENKVEPRRAILCILSALLGGILSVLFVLIRHYGFRKKAS